MCAFTPICGSVGSEKAFPATLQRLGPTGKKAAEVIGRTSFSVFSLSCTHFYSCEEIVSV